MPPANRYSRLEDLYYWRILLIDDDDDDYLLLRLMLSESREGKFTLEWASSYEAGMKMLEEDRSFDAVLVDYDLGANTGTSIIREAVARDYPAPLLLLTGRGTYEIDVEAMEAGAADYLSKREVNAVFLERALRYAIERKKNEMALLESEQRFRAIFENRHSVMLLIDPHSGQIVDVNESACAYYGWTREQMTRMKISEINTLPRPLLNDKLQEANGAAPSVRYNFQHRLASGEVRDVEVRTGPVNIGGKQLLFSIIFDITEHMRAQQAILSNEAQIRALNDQLKFLLKGASLGVWSVGLDGGDFVMDEPCRRMHGFRPDEIVQTLAEANRNMHPEDLSGDDEAFNDALKTGSYSVEYRVVLPSGEMRWIYSFGGLDTDRARIVGMVMDITERKQSEEAIRSANHRLRESEVRFKTMADGTPVMIWVHDTQGQMEFINQAYCEFFGTTLEQVKSGSWQMLVHPEDAAGYVGEFLECTREQRPFRGQCRVMHRDGQWRWLDSHGRPWFSETGAFLGMAGSSLDITERKQAELALEHERNRLLAVMEAMPVSIGIADQTGRLIQYNQEFEAIWGSPPPRVDSAAEYGAYQAWWAESGEPLRAEEWAAAKVLQSGEKVSGQFILVRRPDGTPVYMMHSGAPIRDSSGALTGAVVAQADITRLVEAEAALRQSQDRFRVALSSVTILVYTCDRDLRYTWVENPLRGFRPVDVLGKRDDEILPPEDVAELIAAKQQALDTGQGSVQEVAVPMNGEITYYVLAVEPMRDQHGEITGLTCSAIDITEQKRWQQAQQDQAMQIELQRRLMEQREQDRSAIARELHDGPIQSLSAVLFQLQNAKETLQDPALQAALGKMGLDIQDTVRELRGVMNELRPPALITFGFSKVLQMYVEDLRSRYPDLSIELACEGDDLVLAPTTHIVLFRIFQAGMNNIIRHAQASRAWVHYRVDHERSYLKLEDDGQGFQVKHDLTQLARNGHFGLVGMKERAEAIGGHLTVESTPGQGTVVKVDVPLSRINSLI
jgi:PAS domain S-box-containing protein